MSALRRTLDPESLPLYAETCFTCVICAYYRQKSCADKNIPQLWSGDERTHGGSKKHGTAARNVAVSVQQMTEWLEEESAKLERLGTAPPDAGAAPAAAESPAAASSTPPSFNSQERLQALEEAVTSLQGQCTELRRQNDDLLRRMNAMTMRDEGSNTYYYSWSY